DAGWRVAARRRRRQCDLPDLVFALMRRKGGVMRDLGWFGVLLMAGASAPAWAHHSFSAVYDLKQSVTVKGTIVQVRLTNPHSWFYIDVKNAAGAVEHWAFEAGTPSGMIRNGYKASVIKQGD